MVCPLLLGLFFVLFAAVAIFVTFQLVPQTVLANILLPEYQETNWAPDAGIITALAYIPALLAFAIIGYGLASFLPDSAKHWMEAVSAVTVPSTLVSICNFFAALQRIRKCHQPQRGLIDLWADPAMFRTLRRVALWAMLTSVPMVLLTLLAAFQ